MAAAVKAGRRLVAGVNGDRSPILSGGRPFDGWHVKLPVLRSRL
jgi:hypothetical protein